MPPGGSKPGERRGGRKKGTPNKATVERYASADEALRAAFDVLSPQQIDQISPATVMITAMRGLVRARLIGQAVTLAKEAAPYFDAKLAPRGDASGDNKLVVVVRGGLEDGSPPTESDRAD